MIRRRMFNAIFRLGAGRLMLTRYCAAVVGYARCEAGQGLLDDFVFPVAITKVP